MPCCPYEVVTCLGRVFCHHHRDTHQNDRDREFVVGFYMRVVVRGVSVPAFAEIFTHRVVCAAPPTSPPDSKKTAHVPEMVWCASYQSSYIELANYNTYSPKTAVPSRLNLQVCFLFSLPLVNRPFRSVTSACFLRCRGTLPQVPARSEMKGSLLHPRVGR